MILPQTSAEESRAIQRGDILLDIDQRPVSGSVSLPNILPVVGPLLRIRRRSNTPLSMLFADCAGEPPMGEPKD